MIESHNVNDRLNHLEEGIEKHDATFKRHEKDIENVQEQSKTAINIAYEAKKSAAIVENDHLHFKEAMVELKEVARQHSLALRKIDNIKWSVIGGFTVATMLASGLLIGLYKIVGILIKILKLAS